MERQDAYGEFSAIIKGGKVSVPALVAQRLEGKKLRIRVRADEDAKRFEEKGISESEVERIAMMQRETRENVATFLLAEGALRNDSSFRKRAKRLSH